MNEHQVRQKQMQEASRQFLQALSSGQANPLDRFQNIIQRGQKLLYKAPVDVLFDVVSITPVLDPNVPPGYLDVQLTVTFPVRVLANQQNQRMIVMQTSPAKEEEKPSDTATGATEATPPADGKPLVELTDVK